MKVFLPWVGPLIGAEKENQEEGAAKTRYPLVPLWDRGARSKAEPFKKGQRGQATFSFDFISYYSTIGSKVTFLKSGLFGL